MQATPKKIKARRRKTGRTKAADLFQLSQNGHKLGRTGKRLYASVRLMFTKGLYSWLRAITKAKGITLSKAARICLDVADAAGQGNRAEAMRIYGALIKSRSRKGRKTESKADAWSESAEGRNRRGVTIKVTAWHLANIAAEQDERETTFSRAFVLLAMIPARNMAKDLEAIKRKQEMREAFEEPPKKPKRAKRWRTMTELKRARQEREDRQGRI